MNSLAPSYVIDMLSEYTADRPLRSSSKGLLTIPRINSQADLSRLQLVQNAAARLLTRTGRRSHITPVLASLHRLPVKLRIDFKILFITYKALHGLAPAYVSELLSPYTTMRSVRSSNQNLLAVPRAKLKTKGDCAFAALAPRLWNNLPTSIRSAESVDCFKKHLKTYFFRMAFS